MSPLSDILKTQTSASQNPHISSNWRWSRLNPVFPIAAGFLRLKKCEKEIPKAPARPEWNGKLGLPLKPKEVETTWQRRESYKLVSWCLQAVRMAGLKF